ncbi:hypothetical protein [Niveispirillum sp. BGYR6]|uniref:hypothetical protein n=1 Tax=Niveispirillum sp. BGYR6 TaxID=2971249 RepID=UPI0022B973A7|nr:hypothetical protein [Niveispirillum sp. BGYR6]MDG5496352.1 hypothetical protein [Niveispirillum sp. BGYR6]
MPFYRDEQDQLFWHSAFQPVLMPGVADEERRIWPVIRQIRPGRQGALLRLCQANAALCAALSLAGLWLLLKGQEFWGFEIAIGAFILATAGPSTLTLWAGDDVRFSQPVRLVKNNVNPLIPAMLALTSAPVMFACAQHFIGNAFWSALAALGLMLVHGLRFARIWRQAREQ